MRVPERVSLCTKPCSALAAVLSISGTALKSRMNTRGQPAPVQDRANARRRAEEKRAGNAEDEHIVLEIRGPASGVVLRIRLILDYAALDLDELGHTMEKQER